MTFGAFLEMIFIVITSNQGVTLYVPREESLLIPLKYIDVVRRTNTTLEKCWKVAQTTMGTLMVTGSYSRRGPVSPVLKSERNASKRVHVVRGAFEKISSDIQTGLLMARNVVRFVVKGCQEKERQRWTVEKTKLDNAQKLRGIFHLDPDDMELMDTMKNAWLKKLETQLGSAMTCKFATEHGATCSIKHDSRMTRYAWSGERMTKVQATSRPDVCFHKCCEV